jgi:methylase of polypeptide subunit release factors
MSLLYRLLYRIGFTPWDTGQVPKELSDLIEGPEALPTGRALDIGCGTGTQAVYMACSGWEVTAVDAVPRPLS